MKKTGISERATSGHWREKINFSFPLSFQVQSLENTVDVKVQRRRREVKGRPFVDQTVAERVRVQETKSKREEREREREREKMKSERTLVLKHTQQQAMHAPTNVCPTSYVTKTSYNY